MTTKRGRWSARSSSSAATRSSSSTKGGRQDLVDKEAAEITVLESYLPAAADPAAIERAVAEAIAETGATTAERHGLAS